MNWPTALIELAEKMGLLAAAALCAVLIPPLRTRLLGVGRPRDQLAAIGLGLGLSIWGAMLGLEVQGEHINVRAIGVLIAAILGGPWAGAVAGLGGGLFTAARSDPETAPWVLTASVVDGLLAGFVARRWPRAFLGVRCFLTSVGIQAFHILLVGAGLFVVGHAARYLPAWPAHLVKLVVNGAGVTLFVLVARLVIAREEAAAALASARAAADVAALEALRRKLEPHFLFNALNALRATIRKDPLRARDLVSDLADLYRYLLRHPEDATVADEVSHACAYLAIERVRIGEERLAIETDIEDEASRCMVPALLLQPLVENAVVHGIGSRTGAGKVLIRARIRGEELRIDVEDTAEGVAITPPVEGSGIALAALRQRLSGLYGAAASLALSVSDQGGVCAVRLPRRHRFEERLASSSIDVASSPRGPDDGRRAA